MAPWDERYIYLHLFVDFYGFHVGKYTSPMGVFYGYTFANRSTPNCNPNLPVAIPQSYSTEHEDRCEFGAPVKDKPSLEM